MSRQERLLVWIVPLALIVLWQIAAQLDWLPQNVMAAPSAVLAAAWRLLVSGELLLHIWMSFTRAAIGFLFGASLGFVLGVANGLSRRSELLLDGTLQMLRNVPHLALIPLVIVWFGIGEQSKYFLVALGVFFPIYLNTLLGIRTADPQLIEMAQIYGMSRWRVFWEVILPGALPSIFTGLRYAFGLMWLTLIVAETVSASSGIGYLAMEARQFLLIDVIVLSIIIYALLGKLADIGARLLERLCLAWHPAFQNR